MPTITTKDGTQIYYKDWGSGQPIVFSHGWPLTADDWDGQMLFFGQRGFRVIAHDRRGHGRSTQTWDGNEMDTYADDLAALTEKLDLKNAIHVGHSTGGGEVARYIGRHGTKRVAAAVLISAVPPLMLKTDKNPDGRAHLGLRRPASPTCGQSAAVLQGHYAPVLRLQPARRQDFGRHPGALVVAGHDGRDEGPLRLHQGFLRDGFHRGPQEVRRADSHPSWRRRSDRTDRRGGSDVRQDCEERHAEGVSRFSARDAHNPRGPDQRGLAGILQPATLQPRCVKQVLRCGGAAQVSDLALARHFRATQWVVSMAEPHPRLRH